MNIISIAFWLLLGLLFLGVPVTPYHEIIVGILALVIGISQLVSELRR
jgi:hypothetical protein